MKRIRITLEFLVPDNVPGHGAPERSSINAALSVVRDALAEFQGSRSPVARYVEERYPADKCAEVEARCLLASVMGRSVSAREVPSGFDGRDFPLSARCCACAALVTLGRYSAIRCGVCESGDLVPAECICDLRTGVVCYAHEGKKS